MTSLLYTILHYIRLVWTYISSFFNNNDRSGGGISLSSFFGHKQKILTFDNGLQVQIGKQIAEGGFSYVFEAFPIIPDNKSGTPSKQSRILSSQSSSLTSSSSTTIIEQKYALKRINCAGKSAFVLFYHMNSNVQYEFSVIWLLHLNLVFLYLTAFKPRVLTEATIVSLSFIVINYDNAHLPDHEIIQSCRHEAGIHRSLPATAHPNLLELLGLKFDMDTSMNSSSSSGGGRRGEEHKEYNVCYMLFPYISHSLRGEITKRNILYDPSDYSSGSGSSRRTPFTTKEVLQLFGGILDGVKAMHDANISHRDIKLENVLLESSAYGDSNSRRSSSGRLTPVLMDFGSTGPLTREIQSKQEIYGIVEESASHTTMPYRPPELFDGGLRYTNGSVNVLDYGKVDVWSLGCLLFGLLHGTSPFEIEYSRNNSQNEQQNQYGLVRIVECTHLKILGEVPLPPWARGGNDESGGGSNGKYPISMYKFIQYLVQHDRQVRPNIHEVATKFDDLFIKLVGERWVSYEEGNAGYGGNNSAFDSSIV